MIDLRKEIYYEIIDDTIVAIFDRYKWGLIRLGVKFDQDILEAIAYCPMNLEDSLKAFCAWVLWLKSQGEKLESEVLKQNILDAIDQYWIPYDFQRKFLTKHNYIFDNPQDIIWKKAGEILGNELRNQIITHILTDGTIIFRENSKIKDEDRIKIDQLKLFIKNLDYTVNR